MSIKRALAVSTVSIGMLASGFVAASAQQPQYRGNEGKPRASQQGRPAPQASQRPAAPIVRQPRPHVSAPAPRHVAPPPVRHAAPVLRPSHEAPHRRYGSWRPWGYGAAVAGAVIVGSAIARARPSDAEACANDFRTFDWDSGTIVNEDGDRELCPYLE